jgi:hypothetical protein
MFSHMAVEEGYRKNDWMDSRMDEEPPTLTGW